MIDRRVFLDKSGINTDMTPIYGWGKRANRVKDSAPLNTPKTTAVLSSIRLNGEKAFTIYTGGTTGERFVTYLRETLIPTLKKGNIVVMDNLRSHHVDAVGDLLRQNGITLLYLPPYSPDLNPITPIDDAAKESILDAYSDIYTYVSEDGVIWIADIQNDSYSGSLTTSLYTSVWDLDTAASVAKEVLTSGLAIDAIVQQKYTTTASSL